MKPLGLVRGELLVVTSIQGLVKLIPSSDVTLVCKSATLTGQRDRMRWMNMGGVIFRVREGD